MVEANGHLTAFPAAPNRQPTTSELNVATGYEGLPLPLIMDGRVQENNLQKTGRGEDWLRRVLKEHGLTIKQAYLASLDTQGRLTVQRQEGGVLRFCALDAQEVCW